MQQTRTQRPRAWAAYLAAGAAAIVLYYAFGRLPGQPEWVPRLPLALALHLSTVVALVVGILRYRPARPLAWWLLVANQAVYVAGDATLFVNLWVRHAYAFPSVSDFIYVSAYLPLIAALVLFVRGRSGRDRAAVIDALIIAVGVAVLSWVFVLSPYAAAGLPLLARAMALATPILDLLVLALIVRLLAGRERPSLAFLLLTGAVALQVTADTIYGWVNLNGGFHPGTILDAGWLTAYVFYGAAALHPSMRTLAERLPPRRPGFSRLRLVALAAAALIAPTLLGVQAARGARIDGLAIAVASVVLFLLVVARLSGLMRDQQAALREIEARGERLQVAFAALEQAQADRARLLAQTVRAAEHERIRIAAGLHDGPIQHLASLGYILDRAGRRLRDGDADTGLQHVERARTELSSEVAGLRRLMSELRPPVLDEGGLDAAIRDYAAAFARQHGLHCEVEADLDGAALAPEIETVIYRVTQESLTNVAKHAGADRVRIRVVARGDDAELWIDDDGSGFDPATVARCPREGHFGLIGMRERVESVGGSWELHSAAGAGTSVHAALPSAPTPAATELPELALAS